MRIQLNGEARDFPAPLNLSELLSAAGYGDRRVAVEVNLEIIAKSRYREHTLHEGDRVEIIQAIGGG